MILERREKVLHIAAVQADYRDRRLYLSFGWLLIVWLLAALPLSGQTTAKDIEVAARAVAFLASKPSGSQTTAVVYAPGSADSKADADAIAAILAGGVTANKVTLEAPKVVTASELSSLSGVTVVFVARGMSAHYAAVSQAAAAKKFLTVTSDLDCARGGHCVVGVQAQPSVQILISKQASQAAGQSFSSAFLMMAKEL